MSASLGFRAFDLPPLFGFIGLHLLMAWRRGSYECRLTRFDYGVAAFPETKFHFSSAYAGITRIRFTGSTTTVVLSAGITQLPRYPLLTGEGRVEFSLLA